jgi:hypothetical protein
MGRTKFIDRFVLMVIKLVRLPRQVNQGIDMGHWKHRCRIVHCVAERGVE